MGKAGKGTFLLGVGAQKAGTSWLHAYLHGRDDADFGFLKEYHVHDARTVESLNPFRSLARQRGLRRTWGELQLWARPRTRRRWGFIQHPERYFDYFEGLLARPGIRLTGDITPSYACLEADTFAAIHQALEERGIRLRVVFLLRDPLERIISSVRMNRRKKGLSDTAEEVEALRHAAQRRPRGMENRSDYRRTLENLDRALPPEAVHVGFYETLFNPEGIAEICDHLEVPPTPAPFTTRVNAGSSAGLDDLPTDALADLGRWQRETYRYCLERFAERDLGRLWPTASRYCS